MAADITLAEALNEAQRWVHFLRAAEKLESVLAVVRNAEALTEGSERALRDYDAKINAKQAEVNAAITELANVRALIAPEQARLTAATTEANRVVAAGGALREEESRKTAARLEELANRVAETEARARQRQAELVAEAQALIAQRDAIKAEIDELRRKVMGVGVE